MSAMPRFCGLLEASLNMPESSSVACFASMPVCLAIKPQGMTVRGFERVPFSDTPTPLETRGVGVLGGYLAASTPVSAVG
jgi:hypothetical protein